MKYLPIIVLLVGCTQASPTREAKTLTVTHVTANTSPRGRVDAGVEKKPVVNVLVDMRDVPVTDLGSMSRGK